MIPQFTSVLQPIGSTAGPVPLQFFSGEFLTLAIVFVVLALVAALVGARGVAGISMRVAKWFVIIFVVLAIVSFIL
ncbi:DUF1328 family protein [Halobellus sp. GM3]|uniref:DUF1328 family protein n=1 Tax=Halobellus sp. GM3 TaxID=3458410 RepID=UPI00403D7D56